MPILPLDYFEPFAATLGVMLYPGADEADKAKARAFTSQWLAKPLQQFHAAGHKLSYGKLRQISEAAGERLTDLEERWWSGLTTGDLLKAYFALSRSNRSLASWNSAAKVLESTSTRSKVSGSRTAFLQAKTRFRTVAHLWGAWSIREGKFKACPEVGYDGYADLQSFLAEAEILRDWGQNWLPPRHGASPPLAEDVWRVPDGWRPLQRQSEWPLTGRIPYLELPRELVLMLKPAGRPSARV